MRKWLLTLLVLGGVLLPTAVALAKVVPWCGGSGGSGGFC
jgi:hypothetical protein